MFIEWLREVECLIAMGEEANAFLIDGRNYDRASFMGRAITMHI